MGYFFLKIRLNPEISNSRSFFGNVFSNSIIEIKSCQMLSAMGVEENLKFSRIYSNFIIYQDIKLHVVAGGFIYLLTLNPITVRDMGSY